MDAFRKHARVGIWILLAIMAVPLVLGGAGQL